MASFNCGVACGDHLLLRDMEVLRWGEGTLVGALDGVQEERRIPHCSPARVVQQELTEEVPRRLLHPHANVAVPHVLDVLAADQRLDGHRGIGDWRLKEPLNVRSGPG